jgi:hypothetical protein
VNEQAAAADAAANAPTTINMRSGCYTTLPIQTITHDNIASSLVQTKARVLQPIDPSTTYGNNSPVRGRADSRRQQQRSHDRPSSSHDYFAESESQGGDDGDSEYRRLHQAEARGKRDDGYGNTAILELDSVGESSAQSADNHGRKQNRSAFKRNDASDVNLPLNSFKTQEAFDQNGHPAEAKKPRDFKPEKKMPIRTDVNEKASFLEVPQGKFRREFSTDHPLAAGGTGQYKNELKAGVTPVNMDMSEKLRQSEADQKKGNINKRSNNEQLSTATQVQRLTYEAQLNVVDPDNVLEKLRTEQNEVGTCM